MDDTRYTVDLFEWLHAHYPVESKPRVYLLNGLNTDSGNKPTSINFKEESDFRSAMEKYTVYHALHSTYEVDETALHFAAATARVTKSPAELEVMWYTNLVSSRAHVAVMRGVRPGDMEYQLEARFLYEIYRHGGCRKVAYTCICGVGTNSATLHYGHAGAPNSREVGAGEMALMDMGAEVGRCCAVHCVCMSVLISCVCDHSTTHTPRT